MAVQEGQDAAQDTQSAVLREQGSQEAARQVEVDAESAALQKPETQEAVKQVQVDAESAQLQKPETQQVTLLSLASLPACGHHRIICQISQVIIGACWAENAWGSTPWHVNGFYCSGDLQQWTLQIERTINLMAMCADTTAE